MSNPAVPPSDSIVLTPPKSPVSGSIKIPASKSFSNRALVTAALASGRSIIRNASPSEDSIALMEGLRALGIGIAHQPDGSVMVDGGIERIEEAQRVIDVGPAGTTMRFLVGLLAATQSGETIIKGSERMHRRPIGDLVETLRSLGAAISYEGTPGCPPLRIEGKTLRGGIAEIPGTTSSQFISALLLASPCFSGGLTLRITGDLVSSSYVGTTLSVMEQFGVSVHKREEVHEYHIPAGSCYRPIDYHPEGDATGATYWWGIAAIAGASVTVRNISRTSRQGDIAFLDILESMGCTVTGGDEGGIPWVQVTGPERLVATTADLTLLPDSAQTLAVVAACAEGTTTMTGLETLSLKESDRIGDTITELASLGITATGTDRSMTIIGGRPHPTRPIATYHDHRMAMAFAMLATKIQGIVICDPLVTGKSYPDFWRDLATLGIDIEEKSGDK